MVLSGFVSLSSSSLRNLGTAANELTDRAHKLYCATCLAMYCTQQYLHPYLDNKAFYHISICQQRSHNKRIRFTTYLVYVKV